VAVGDALRRVPEEGFLFMLDRGAYSTSNFSLDPCPICGERFSRCGLPNHIRRHNRATGKPAIRKATERVTAAWWEGWKEGYKAGLRDQKAQQPQSDGLQARRADYVDK